ncbi:MAG: 4-hydroxythreonine-4-phosphate dehydrogenase PdxA [Chloracidobacterium sp.]|nr:4-hydroxythreonine-4-phosphate dehydrogenase PdxA [Chloracidobacterium sp.]
MSFERPIIGITMGDAAGIGPEIVLRALSDDELRTVCQCVIIGDAVVLHKTADALKLDIEFAEIGSGKDVEVFDLKNLPDKFEYGVDGAATGKASAEYIETAVHLWQEKKINAICTAPISKKSLSLGGYDFQGHTEFLASLTGTEKFAMSFFGGDLRVVLHSTHLSLRDAIDKVKKESLVKLIEFSNSAFQQVLGKNISLAVAGLNPHASEGGMFGHEEQAEIIPAINYCRDKLGIDVSGPYSPDTIFMRGFKGEFDAVVALYHDQATIAVKSLAFGSAVNVTLGLPLIRTSVDHGTAFDIAGKGVADASSMIAAIKLAGELASRSRINTEV